MTITDWIQAIFTIALVGVTAYYAWQTKRTVSEMKNQAEASIKMAEEMKEHRYSEFLPLLVPSVPPKKNWLNDNQNLNTNEVERVFAEAGMKTIWRNVGKGPAINVSFSFFPVHLDSKPNKALRFTPRIHTALGIGEQKEVDFSPPQINLDLQNTPETYLPRLQAEYQDINKRHITTIQELHINEKNKVFLGDLYFEVNNQRLGKEVVQK